MEEAKIIINGVPLTNAQAITVRVAIGDMLLRFSDPEALGADNHEQAMVRAYVARASEVQDLIFKNIAEGR